MGKCTDWRKPEASKKMLIFFLNISTDEFGTKHSIHSENKQGKMQPFVNPVKHTLTHTLSKSETEKSCFHGDDNGMSL